jgi:DNA-binding CsgD family transcriptional regulator
MLVGREGELVVLTSALDAVRGGEGRVLMLGGEPGIGKTRLVTELTRLAGEREIPTLVGRTLQEETAPALWPWWEALLGRPELDLLDDIAGGDEIYSVARLRAFEKVLTTLSSSACGQGLVVVLEDLQWADEATLKLLCQGVGKPWLTLVGTYRTNERPAALRNALTALDRTGSAVLLRPRAWSAEEVALAAAAAHPSWHPVLYRESGGNPLFVLELLSSLREAALAAEPAPADGRWPFGVPENLASITAARVAGLSDAGQRAVAVAGVLGTECGCAELTALGGDGEQAMEALEEAAAAGLLTEVGGLPARFRFTHALLRDAVYARLTVQQRLEWHRKAAEAIENGQLAGEPATHRLRCATDDDSRALAVAACRQAAATAVRFAPDRAVRILDAALALPGVADEDRLDLVLMAAEAEYSGGRTDAAVRRCDTAMTLAERVGPADALVRAALVVHGIGGPANVGVLALCDRALAALPADAVAGRARVLAQRTIALGEVLGFEQVDEDSREALRLAESSGDPLALADAFRARQHAASGPDGVTERLELARRILELAGRGGPEDAELWGRLWRIDASLQLGALDVVDTELTNLGILADRHGWPIAHWHLHRLSAARQLLAGRFAGAEAESDLALEWANRTEDWSAIGIDGAFRIELLALQGRHSEHVELMRAMGPVVRLPIFWALAGKFLWEAGDSDVARDHFEDLRRALPRLDLDGRWLGTVTGGGQLAIALGELDSAALCYELLLPYQEFFVAGGSGSVLCLGSVSRSLGMLAAALGRPEDAERHFTEAIGIDDRTGALPYRTLSELSLAELLHQRGTRNDLTRAAGYLERVVATAERLRMRPTLLRAKELLGELRRHTPGLTRREREVLGLLSGGRSNREIAGELVLSERTVETHVANVLGKLGLANRSQAAAWAARNQIT